MVWRILSDDAFFESRIHEKIEALRTAEPRAGADFLNSVPGTPEMAAEQFALRREVVESINDK
jgi:hypothetical protein